MGCTRTIADHPPQFVRIGGARAGYSSAQGWRDHDLVFCRVDGSPLHPDRFSARFVDKARLLGLPPIRLHELRHTRASLALADGVHPKIVQERLGHANISITLDIYSHVTAGLHSDAATGSPDSSSGSGDSLWLANG